MQREIKFRVWDKRNKKWVEAGQSLLGYLIAWISDYKFEILGRGDYEIVQYSGLKDKNGREIYEGDILKDTDNEIYYVDFIRGCFYLRTNYKSFPHLRWAEWLPMCEIDRLANPTEFEVIGNIYENPELLEG